MADIQVSLDLLKDSLKYKLKLLKEIMELTTSQGELLRNEGYNEEEFGLLAMKKGSCLDELNILDEGFRLTYERMGGVLGSRPDLYKNTLLLIQSFIREIGELSIEIQVAEKKNVTQLKLSSTRHNKSTPDMPRMSPRAITGYYKNMKDRKKHTDSLFDKSE